MMREANFTNVFFGIETPEPEALKAMKKGHNMTVPILEAIKTLNGYGIEVASGIIMGLDTDTPRHRQAIMDFIEQLEDPDADDQPAPGAAAARRSGTGSQRTAG